ncbi:MAG: formyltetrahydrofolate deformylase [Actinobacteria bacterium]|nr:formyltetrahydrofolate deformylase [Actinomycetota bacterium]MSY38932.1 formyltetrahydrofolate deformylase [Actinomycetota bacterium]
MAPYILTLRCADGPGIVHAITGSLLGIGGNILEQAQFTDEDSGIFSLRTKFESPQSIEVVRAAVEAAAAPFNAEMSLRHESDRRRALIMVSKFDHCLVDLLYRQEIGELPIEIPVIVSNHMDCEHIAKRHGIEFVYLPVTPENKSEQENALLKLTAEHNVDVVILARYMQVLSDALCSQLSGRIINIHHSFLPGFKGARPYHQAHERGVKLIGATAHFVTAQLDEGPIIEQEVERVTHAHTANDLAEIGRDVERLVLARAVRLFAEDRIMLTGKRTVVFQ